VDEDDEGRDEKRQKVEEALDEETKSATDESASDAHEEDAQSALEADDSSGITPRVIEVRVPKPFNPYGNGGGLISPRVPNPHLPIALPDKTTTAKIPFPAALPPEVATEPTTPTENIQVMVNFTQYCPPVSARGLFWNWTRADSTAVLQCPAGSSGFAKWRCDSDSRWAAGSPSLSGCRSLWLGDLDARLREGVPVANISRSLAYHSGLRPVYAGDVATAARMVKHLAERMSYEMQRTTGLDARESMVTELVQNAVRAGSNVLDRMNHRAWSDLGADEAGRTATALMVGLEENAFLLAGAVTSEKIIIKPTDNICK